HPVLSPLLSLPPPPPAPPLFPYTTLFRSPVATRFDAVGLSRRIELIGGDCHRGVPQGADCYVVKHVLHNWDDERALGILRHCAQDRKSTRLNSSHVKISYAVFCLKKKKQT